MITRGEAIGSIILTGTMLAVRSAAIASPFEEHSVTILCVIRYQLDATQLDHFQTYAENWGKIIPRCGGHLVGYYLPHEGTNDVGWGLISFESLASYERYKARLKADPEAIANFTTAREQRCILREERNFVRLVDGTFNLPSLLPRDA